MTVKEALIMDYNREFVEKLRAVMASRGISTAELSKQVQSGGGFYRILTGASRAQLATLEKLSRILGGDPSVETLQSWYKPLPSLTERRGLMQVVKPVKRPTGSVQNTMHPIMHQMDLAAQETRKPMNLSVDVDGTASVDLHLVGIPLVAALTILKTVQELHLMDSLVRN